jgi:hypothetical protein
MVNMNQTGEAAGVAAVLAMRGKCPIRSVDSLLLRHMLTEGGSLFPS